MECLAGSYFSFPSFDDFHDPDADDAFAGRPEKGVP